MFMRATRPLSAVSLARRAFAPRRRPRPGRRDRARARRRPRRASPRRSSAIPRNGSSPVEEGGDGDLVRGVEGARVRCRRASPASRASASSGNVSRSGALELERRGPAARSSGGDRRRRALRVGERVRDRHAHVRVAEVRERGAVAEAHERVDDRRRVDDDLDPVVRQAEEEVRLDQLEPLVRERRRVDRDLRAHAPGRVRERLLGRHVLELVARAAAERAARAR